MERDRRDRSSNGPKIPVHRMVLDFEILFQTVSEYSETPVISVLLKLKSC